MEGHDSSAGRMSRRGFLRAATGGAAAAGGVAVTSGSAAAQAATVTVGPGGNLVFDPATVYVAPGETVKWTWDSNNHNIVVQSQPEGANWKGTKGPQTKTYNEGHTHEHTFETKGTYEYVCFPHAPGMAGEVIVNESGSSPTPKPSSGPPEIPDSAKTLGIATGFGMLSTLGLAYFFMKYGGDYETPEE
ncbi:MAG: plastocyanin/azurin family copper-binding protein [Haloglomus sp.]